MWLMSQTENKSAVEMAESTDLAQAMTSRCMDMRQPANHMIELTGRGYGCWVCAVEQVQAGWQVNQHHQSPQHIQQAVATMMTIRLASDHQPSAVLMALPDELMFLIFSFLPWWHM
jgi:hypothetical protein